jgi:hypothetical protein
VVTRLLEFERSEFGAMGNGLAEKIQSDPRGRQLRSPG